MRVLVLDGRSRATITIIRSLGRAGLYVDVGDEYKTYSSFSKYCRNAIIYPSAESKPKDFKRFMTNLIQKEIYDAIIPVRDATTSCLVELNEVHNYQNILLLPSIMDYQKALGKILTIKLAENLGIPHPKSLPITNQKEAEDILLNINCLLDFPIIIKPSRSSGSRGIIKVSNQSELKKGLDSLILKYKEGIIQEFVPHGGSYGVEMLYYKGKMKVKFTHKRLREYPISGGPSTYRCSCHYEEIERYSENLLNSLNWNGVAMVEWRVDKSTGIPKLMEINPRFWGSLAMAYHAGIDFPKLLLDLVTNQKCEEINDYKDGIKTRWLLFGDILWFFSKGKDKKEISDFFNFFDRNTFYDIIDKDDFQPVFGILLDSFKTLCNKNKLRHIFSRGI